MVEGWRLLRLNGQTASALSGLDCLLSELK
jgi:hypothetical protein